MQAAQNVYRLFQSQGFDLWPGKLGRSVSIIATLHLPQEGRDHAGILGQ